LLGRIEARHKAALALAALWALFFAPQLLSDGVPYYRDTLLTQLPIKAYLAERLRKGELPGWYPYESLGVAFIGQVVTSTFHPQTLLSLFLSAATALKVNILGAHLVALVGAYRLSRELRTSRPAAVAGACAFAFGGYALGMSSNLTYLVGLATLPWVAATALRCARRARLADAAGLGCAWALVFLSGDAQSFALCPLLLFAALAVHGVRARSVLSMVGAGALATALCSAELLPALALSPTTMRGAGTPSATIGLTWALHPLRLPELFMPGYIPDVQRIPVASVLLGSTALWSSSIFAGGLTLLFAAAALATRDRRALAFAGAGGRRSSPNSAFPRSTSRSSGRPSRRSPRWAATRSPRCRCATRAGRFGRRWARARSPWSSRSAIRSAGSGRRGATRPRRRWCATTCAPHGSSASGAPPGCSSPAPRSCGWAQRAPGRLPRCPRSSSPSCGRATATSFPWCRARS
jgi:hypothetical protein